jgi:hypothetical protein
MDHLKQNNGKSREEKSVNTTNVYIQGETGVDPQDIPIFRAMNTAKLESNNGYSGGTNGNYVNGKSKQMNGKTYMNGNNSINGNGLKNGNSSMNGNGSVNGKGTLNGNGTLNGKSAANGNGSTNGSAYINGNGSSNGKTNGNEYRELNGKITDDKNEEQPEVFKGVKYFNTEDQSFSFTIESPRYVVLIVTNRLTMREEILVNQKLMPGDYIVMLNREIVTPGFHYYKLYYEADGSTADAYRFNDIKPEKKFYLETIKEVTVL